MDILVLGNKKESKTVNLNTHLGLQLFKDGLQLKIDNPKLPNGEKVAAKLAMMMCENIQELLDRGILTETEVSEMIVDHNNINQILNNT